MLTRLTQQVKYACGMLKPNYPVPALMYEYDTVHQWETGECLHASLGVWDGNMCIVVQSWDKVNNIQEVPMRHPINATELAELEQLQHETGLKGDALLAEWNTRLAAEIEQSPQGSPSDPEHMKLPTFDQSGRSR